MSIFKDSSFSSNSVAFHSSSRFNSAFCLKVNAGTLLQSQLNHTESCGILLHTAYPIYEILSCESASVTSPYSFYHFFYLLTNKICKLTISNSQISEAILYFAEYVNC